MPNFTEIVRVVSDRQTDKNIRQTYTEIIHHIYFIFQHNPSPNPTSLYSTPDQIVSKWSKTFLKAYIEDILTPIHLRLNYQSGYHISF